MDVFVYISEKHVSSMMCIEEIRDTLLNMRTIASQNISVIVQGSVSRPMRRT